MFMPKTPLGRGLALSALVGVGGLGWTAYRLLYSQPPQVWEKHVVPHGPLVPLAGNLWQVTGQVEPKSDAVMRNMVVYRLPRSDAIQAYSTEPRAVAPVSAASAPTEPKEESREELLLHSVIALSDEGMQALDNLGRVKYILVPSPFHRLDAAVYKQRYPDAQVICPKSIRKQVSKVVPVDAVVEDVFGHNYASQGLKCYTPGAGLYIPELVYELPLKEEKDATQETAAMESDKKALVCCDLVTNVAEGPLNVRILGIVTGGNNPVVPWMPRYFFVRDRAQTKRFWETLSRRDDIGLLVMAHGEPVKCEPNEMKRHLANLAAQF